MSYQPYAPSAYLPTPLRSNPHLNLNLELKLFSTPSSRELYESLAELHAIIVTLEFLEKAFVRDSIPPSSYTPTCLRLLGQYKTLLGSPSVAAAFGDLHAFRARYGVDCPAATRRLETGLPATVEHGAGEGQERPMLVAAPHLATGGEGRWRNVSPKAAAEATQNFITFMDALRLNYRAKDELHPLLASVITAVDVVTGGGGAGGEAGGGGFEGRKDIVKWLIVLNQMRPGDEIDEGQGREMLWDLERGYNSFLEGLG
ncbi:vacuolar protein sorting-associated [Tricharina praecox]|uniref:vacuolar protein sorting-associated n=1 Tax=Tricharina praecox TaxID=43433 RepID=UPI00221E950B|nr:vacuolar protein sorting-associated [Tricharina praecox]KAI5853597.1 vacuolar protein sorting-associated [Tricharina praecox]